MIEVRRQALVMYSAEQMFNIVNDIEAYPEFIANCKSSSVTQIEGDLFQGELVLSKAGFDVCFITENRLQRFSKIELTLLSGPLKNLRGLWQFRPLGNDACEILFELSFEAKGLLNKAVGLLVKQVSDQMVQQFCLRAEQIYGVR